MPHYFSPKRPIAEQVALVLADIDSEDYETKSHGISEAGLWRIGAAVPRLIKLLNAKDQDLAIRGAALWALADIKLPESRVAIETAAQSDDTPRIREWCQAFLAFFDQPPVVMPLPDIKILDENTFNVLIPAYLENQLSLQLSKSTNVPGAVKTALDKPTNKFGSDFYRPDVIMPGDSAQPS